MCRGATVFITPLQLNFCMVMVVNNDNGLFFGLFVSLSLPLSLTLVQTVEKFSKATSFFLAPCTVMSFGNTLGTAQHNSTGNGNTN